MRPLGVPTAPWRVVLHMWNGFLTLFLEEEIRKYNHAYMPGVGTTTAIRQLITEVVSHKFIYEFDIKGFFNNVSIYKTVASLRERGMPFESLTKLSDILYSLPANLDLRNESTIKSEYDRELAARKHLESQGLMEAVFKLFGPSEEKTPFSFLAEGRGLPQQRPLQYCHYWHCQSDTKV